MIDCLIIGDSIAVGVKMFRPECVDYANCPGNEALFTDEDVTTDDKD